MQERWDVRLREEPSSKGLPRSGFVQLALCCEGDYVMQEAQGSNGGGFPDDLDHIIGATATSERS
jgi:hypothetical protein